ncbi:MAG: Ig-like domain-containing protein, partial [Ilumatobacteraceae bacterium]
MHNRARRGWQAVVLLVVAGLVASIVVAAVQAHGRADVRTSTNDGGAWLIRRDRGLVGHMNRSVGEVTGTVKVAAPGAIFDVEQSAAVLAADDASSNTVSIIDPRTFQVSNPIAVATDTRLIATDAGAVLWTPSPLQVWRLSPAQLADATDLTKITPLVAGKGAGLVTANADSTMWVVDAAAGTASQFADDETAGHVVQLGDLATKATAVSMVGDDLVITAGPTAAVVDAEGTVRPVTSTAGAIDGAVLAQPSPSGSAVVMVAADGTILTGAVAGGALTTVGASGGATPVAPIAHDGCIYAVVAAPPTFTRTCAGTTDQTTPLDGVTGSSLRLRLVNGWIWVNDLDTGATWITSNDSAVDKVDDWGSDLSNSNGQGKDNDQAGGKGEEQDNPDANDAIFKRADQIDDDGINQPPVARDDAAATRADQPVIVKVLHNDEDPDGDVLLVSVLSNLPADAAVTPTADRTAVQVTPPPGFTGSLSFTYTITDGRGGDASANVAVDVSPNDGSNNRPPVTATDVAEARAGAPASVNVLANDSDPDGDTLVLEGATAESGSVVFDPTGQVTFTPDPGTPAGTVPVAYTAADAFGATTTGALRVQIRLTGSNNEPDARNDAAVTVIDKPVTLDVLANDTDPDGDPLSVAAAPALVSPADVDPSTFTVSLSEDGQFFFVAAQPGQYLFRYSIIDGSEGDTATIRVDVDPAAENRQPIAVRDDVTIGRGGTRTLYPLQNDADPDGDVIALTGFATAPGIDVDEVAGVGLRITVHPDAPNRIPFNYTISDGRSDPVTGTILVSVSNTASIDQAPIAKPDIIEVRPGRTATVPVLLNDFDPEGEPIHVGNVATSPTATARIGPGGQEIYVTVAPTAVTGFSFAYDVVDSAGNRSGSFVQVRLVPDGEANRPPIARADVARTRSGSTISISVLGNDSDPDGDPIRIDSIAAQPAFGQVTVNPDDSVTYTSVAGFSGTDRFRYVVIDSKGDQAIGDVLIGVLPTSTGNTPPTASDDAYTVLAGSDTSRFTLIYTNRSTLDVMFLEELAELKDRYPARLALHHVLSREQRAAPLLSGRIDAEKLSTMLDVLVPPEHVTEWFLCGPFELVELC